MIGLLISLSIATNTGFEGLFFNNAKEPIYCYKDVDGCLDVRPIAPGGSCQADAVRLPTGVLFKIPNHSAFVCDQTCRPYEISSQLVLMAAKAKKGSEHYGEMTLEKFRTLIRVPYCEVTEGGMTWTRQ